MKPRNRNSSQIGATTHVERRAQQQQRRPFVGAERFEQLLFFGVDHRRPDRAQHDERDEQQQDQAANPPPAHARGAQAELPGAHDASAHAREQDRHEDERDVLHDRVGDRQAPGDVRGGDADPERRSRQIDDQAADRRQRQAAEERRRRHPRRPVGCFLSAGAPLRRERPLERIGLRRGWLAGSRGRLEARHRFSLRGRARRETRSRTDGRASPAKEPAGAPRAPSLEGPGTRFAGDGNETPASRHPVPGRELGDEERHQQAGPHEHGHARAGVRGQPSRQPDAQREQHDEKARQRHQRLRGHRI